MSLACVAIPLRGASAFAEGAASVGTVPFVFDDNRIFAEIAFARPDGALRKALAFVDLGTPELVVTESILKELRIQGHGSLALRIGALAVQVDASTIVSSAGLGRTGPDGKATVPVEAVLPGSVMKNYQVIFDYAKRSLTLARPGTLTPGGIPVPCRVNETTGWPSVTAVIAGRAHAMAIDSGSAYTWVRDDVARRWASAHPGWMRGKGAVGEANMQTRTGGAEAGAIILRVPEIRLGPLRLEQIGVLGIAPEAPPFPPVPGESAVRGSLFDWYAKKEAEPVIGWLGGNVLRGFRVTIDYPRRMTYWEKQNDLDPQDLDQVGVTLETRDGQPGYFIAGIAENAGGPTVEGPRIGDRLIQVDDLFLEGARRGALLSALHGKPRSVRLLTLERGGKRMTVPARTSAF